MSSEKGTGRCTPLFERGQGEKGLLGTAKGLLPPMGGDTWQTWYRADTSTPWIERTFGRYLVQTSHLQVPPQTGTTASLSTSVFCSEGEGLGLGLQPWEWLLKLNPTLLMHPSPSLGYKALTCVTRDSIIQRLSIWPLQQDCLCSQSPPTFTSCSTLGKSIHLPSQFSAFPSVKWGTIVVTTSQGLLQG